MFLHVSLIYTLPNGESKSKPTQHSIRKLQELGIQPDLLLCRTSQHLDESFRRKIALLCGINEESILEGLDTKCVDEIPLNFEEQGMGHLVSKKLGLERRATLDAEWIAMVEKLKNPKRSTNIAIVGKYTTGSDAYISVQEAIKHGGVANEAEVNIEWIEAESLTDHSNFEKIFENIDGILVPGGFGDRGMEGMITAAKYARGKSNPIFRFMFGDAVSRSRIRSARGEPKKCKQH